MLVVGVLTAVMCAIAVFEVPDTEGPERPAGDAVPSAERPLEGATRSPAADGPSDAWDVGEDWSAPAPPVRTHAAALPRSATAELLGDVHRVEVDGSTVRWTPPVGGPHEIAWEDLPIVGVAAAASEDRWVHVAWATAERVVVLTIDGLADDPAPVATEVIVVGGPPGTLEVVVDGGGVGVRVDGGAVRRWGR